MITITPEAAAQIKISAQKTNIETPLLRIAARKDEDGSIEYGMGFDEQTAEDTRLTSEGVDVLISSVSESLLSGAVLDFVEINPGEHQFIFINPNDPNHNSAAGSKNSGDGGA